MNEHRARQRRAASGRSVPFVVGALLGSLVSLSSPLRAADDSAINEAIDRGIEFLSREIDKELAGEHKVGQVALETYALVVAGVDRNSALMRKNFEYLRKNALGKHTYTLACYAFALDAAISQEEHDLLILRPKRQRALLHDDPRIGREYRDHLSQAVSRIASGQNAKGSWRYNMDAEDFDNSNVQFAVLGLGVGAKRSVPIEPKVWQGVVEHFVKYQQKDGKPVTGRVTLTDEKREEKIRLIADDEGKKDDSRRRRGSAREERGRTIVREAGPEEPEVGIEQLEVEGRGWGYVDEGFRWNMTCAGLSSMILARDNLRGRVGLDAQKAMNKAIRDGYGWVMANWSPTKSYYGIYSLEKVADLGGVAKFDGHDWYAEVSDYLVEQQQGDGSWKGGGSHGENPRVATSFALLVLTRATSLLTRNPASRMIISGRNAPENEGLADRNWVYVPDLDVTMHYPTLMRTIRLRPHPALIKFLESIVANYAPEWKGELIPEMVKLRQGLEDRRIQGYRSAQRVIDGYLEEIVGAEYDDFDKYVVWYRRWDRVNRIGREQRTQNIPELLNSYEKTNSSVVLKKTIMWALIQCKAREALPLFLADLESDDASLRQAAYDAFRAFFIERPPVFDAAATQRVREDQVETIRSWYERQAS